MNGKVLDNGATRARRNHSLAIMFVKEELEKAIDARSTPLVRRTFSVSMPRAASGGLRQIRQRAETG